MILFQMMMQNPQMLSNALSMMQQNPQMMQQMMSQMGGTDLLVECQEWI